MFSPQIKGYLQQQQQPFGHVLSLPPVAYKMPPSSATTKGIKNRIFSTNTARSNAPNTCSTLTTNHHAYPPQQQQPATQQQAQSMSMNNVNNELPTTSLYPAGQYDSNDSLHDLKMYGSFNSSDAGMANMMSTPIPSIRAMSRRFHWTLGLEFRECLRCRA